ncbi:hypothetical protein GCM10007079_25190 [Nocardiopsis terrae]|nr:hypothetical protein GCM10007079_25190 [Nocardiopsis terrae]
MSWTGAAATGALAHHLATVVLQPSATAPRQGRTGTSAPARPLLAYRGRESGVPGKESGTETLCSFEGAAWMRAGITVTGGSGGARAVIDPRFPRTVWSCTRRGRQG